MILVDYRGRSGEKYIYVRERQNLVDCIEWMKGVLANMEAKGLEWDSIIDFKEQDGDRK